MGVDFRLLHEAKLILSVDLTKEEIEYIVNFDGFEALDLNGKRYYHSIAFGTETCGVCFRDVSEYEDIMTTEAPTLLGVKETIYCYNCIEFIPCGSSIM